jgi:hypothetical protein
MKPLDHSTFKRDPILSISRAAMATLRSRLDRSMTADEHAAKAWPFDEDAHLIVRAATSPHTMTDTAALVQIAAAVFPMLEPYSAAAQLFDMGLSVPLGREFGGVTVPGLATVPVAFVAEGDAKPVLQGTSAGARLDPHKVAGITVASTELFAQDPTETFMRAMLAQSLGPVLDAAVFSNAAATPAQPAGLLNGIAPLTEDPGTGQKSDAMVADLAKLAAAIAPVAGASKIAFVGNLAQITAIVTRGGGQNANIIALAAAVPEGTVIAVAVNAVVSAAGVPEFEISTQATLTMDSAPAAFPAPPVSSMFQTASVAVKMVAPATWALRSPQGAAWIQNANW